LLLLIQYPFSSICFLLFILALSLIAYATGCPDSSWTTSGRRADRLKLVRLLDKWSIPQLWHGYSFFPSHASVSPGLMVIANALRVGDRLIEQLK